MSSLVAGCMILLSGGLPTTMAQNGSCAVANITIIVPSGFKFCTTSVNSLGGTYQNTDDTCTSGSSTTSASSTTGASQCQSPNCISELSTRYTNCYQLSSRDDHFIYWSVSGTRANIAMRARGTGWVAIGLSTDGTMHSSATGSDVMLGWVKADGNCDNGCVYDYWATEHSLPTLDTNQDLTLVRGWEESGNTVIEFTREIATADTAQDRAFDSSLTLIWAFQASLDPTNNISFSRHSNMGSQQIDFTVPHTCVSTSTSGVATTGTGSTTNNLCADCIELNWKFPSFSIPSADTAYVCVGFEFPTDVTRDVILFEAKLDNELMVHHMLLYDIPSIASSTPHSCATFVGTPLWGWTPGGTPFAPPSNAGFRIGNRADGHFQYMALQIHYDNPQGLTGQIDSSGIRMVATTSLRENQASILTIGRGSGSIPPGQSSFALSGECTASSTNYIPQPGLNVFSYSPHMHYLGKKLWTDIVGSDKVVRTTLADMAYNFNDQRYHNLDTIVLIKPGDYINTTCVWDSSSKTETTQFGEATTNEMCLMFLAYYPKLPISICVS